MQLQASATVEHDAPEAHHGVRMYRAMDEPRVLDLLTRSLNRWRTCPDPMALWRWKHFANPFGPSCVLVHETPDGDLAGVVALMFWRLRQGKRMLKAERSTELATHADHRRQGVASSFYAKAWQYLKDEGVGLVFHTPNQHSLRFTRNSKRPVFQMRPRFGIRNPARVALACAQLGRMSGPDDPRDPPTSVRRMPAKVSAIFNNREALAELVAEDAARRGPRLQTARTVEYLYWRYAAHPTITYYAVCTEAGGRLDGCVIFRIDRFGSARRVVVQELLMRQSGDRVARALKRELDAAVDADLVQYYDSEGPWTDLLPGHALPGLNAFNFTIGSYDPALGRSPLELANWSLTLGDLQEI